MPSIVLRYQEYKNKNENLPALKGLTIQETKVGNNTSSGEVLELLKFTEFPLCAQYCPKCIYICHFIQVGRRTL